MGPERSVLKNGIALLLSLLLAAVIVPVAGADDDNLPPAARSLLLDIVPAGATLIAVGERGHVLRYRPAGGWQPRPSETGILLTAVDFAGADRGCAVGHDAVIICTRDGGLDWQLVHRDATLQAPLLDILFIDADRAIAVGAWGLYLTSEDGGRSWQQREFDVVADGTPWFTEAASNSRADLAADYDLHLNAITRGADGNLYLAAEAGRLFVSDNKGVSWRILPSPYRGSWFGIKSTPEGQPLVYGLRGRVFELAGADCVRWRPIDNPGEEQLTDALSLPDGAMLIVGQGGTLLYQGPGESDYRHFVFPGRPSLQAVTLLPPDTLVFASDRGLLKLPLAALDTGVLSVEVGAE